MRTPPKQESAKAKWESAIQAEMTRSGAGRMKALSVVAKARPALRKLLITEANSRKER